MLKIWLILLNFLVRDECTGAYICTIKDEEEGRILSLSSTTNLDTFVTGGLKLKLWKKNWYVYWFF